MVKIRKLSIDYSDEDLIDIRTHEARFFSSHPQGIGNRDFISVEKKAFISVMDQLEGEDSNKQLVLEDLQSYYRYCCLVEEEDSDAYEFIEELFCRYVNVLRNFCMTAPRFPSIIRVGIEEDGYGEDLSFNIRDLVYLRKVKVDYSTVKERSRGSEFICRYDDFITNMAEEKILLDEGLRLSKGVPLLPRKPFSCEISLVHQFFTFYFPDVPCGIITDIVQNVMAVEWLTAEVSCSRDAKCELKEFGWLVREVISHVVSVRVKARGFCSGFDARAPPLVVGKTVFQCPRSGDGAISIVGLIEPIDVLSANLKFDPVSQFLSQVLFLSNRYPVAYSRKAMYGGSISRPHFRIPLLGSTNHLLTEIVVRYFRDLDIYAYRFVNKFWYNQAVARYNSVKKDLFDSPLVGEYSVYALGRHIPRDPNTRNIRCKDHDSVYCVICKFGSYLNLEKNLKRHIIMSMSAITKKEVRTVKDESFPSFCDRVVKILGSSIASSDLFVFVGAYAEINHALGYFCCDRSAVDLIVFSWFTGCPDRIFNDPGAMAHFKEFVSFKLASPLIGVAIEV